jgi:penicillin-binding protein 1A
MLAGLPKAPSLYSPFNNFERARARQAYVLERMYEDGYITKQDRDRALNTLSYSGR